LIIVLLAVVPFIVNQQTLTQISLSSSIISSLSSLVTLVIALLLFNRFGIENKLLEKNLETTERLLSELGKIRIIFKSNNILIQFFPLRKEFYRQHKEIKAYMNMKIIFSMDSLRNLGGISEFAYDPFLPKSIATALKSFEFMYGKVVSNTKNKSDFLQTDIYSSNVEVLYNEKDNENTYHLTCNSLRSCRRDTF